MLRLFVKLPCLEFVHIVEVFCLPSCVRNVFIHVFYLGVEIHSPVFIFFTFAFTLALTVTLTLTFTLVRRRLWVRRARRFVHIGTIVCLDGENRTARFKGSDSENAMRRLRKVRTSFFSSCCVNIFPIGTRKPYPRFFISSVCFTSLLVK